MGLYIKGMCMPENCMKCQLMTGTFCDILNKDVDPFYEGAKKRYNNCPLVALPEKHGDLIDRDKVIPKLNFINEAEHQIYGRASWGFTAKCIYAIDDAPTVIEAEDSE